MYFDQGKVFFHQDLQRLHHGEYVVPTTVHDTYGIACPSPAPVQVTFMDSVLTPMPG